MLDSPDVVIPVSQELPEYVDGHDSKSTVGFDFQNGEDGLVEDRVSNVLRRVGVRSDLISIINDKLKSALFTFTPLDLPKLLEKRERGSEDSPAPEYRSSPHSPSRLLDPTTSTTSRS